LGYFVLFPLEYKNLGLHTLAGLFFISNFLLLTENDYFNKASELKILLSLWSLSVEVQLYIIISILFILIKIFQLSIKYIFILILISFFISISNINNALIFYLPLTRFFEFGLGYLTAAFSYYYQFSKILIFKENSFILNFFSSILIILLISYVIFFLNKDVVFNGIIVIFPILVAIFFIIYGDYLNNYFNNSIIVFFGLISYPLYLIHWPLLVIYKIMFALDPDVIIKIFLILFSILSSTIFYRLIEIPSYKLKSIRLHFLMWLFLASSAIFVIFNDGLPNRIKGTFDEKKWGNDLSELKINGRTCFPDLALCQFGKDPTKRTIYLLGDSQMENKCGH